MRLFAKKAFSHIMVDKKIKMEEYALLWAQNSFGTQNCGVTENSVSGFGSADQKVLKKSDLFCTNIMFLDIFHRPVFI
jgi:hypothetical protein